MNPLDDDVRSFLDNWRPPKADPAAKAELLHRLQRVPSHPVRHPLRLSLRWGWLIVRSQMRLVHPITCVASALVMAIGGVVTLAMYQPASSGGDLPFVLVAPLVAAVGIAFLYGSDSDLPLELQLATPVSHHIVLLARLAILFSLNLLLGIVCSVVLTLAETELSLMSLILAWLAPMTALSALAFLMSVLLFDPLVSVLLSMAIWVSQVARQFDTVLPAFHDMPDLLRVELYPLMFAAAASSILLALWLADHDQRWSAAD